jgi:hypothetical protein
MLNETLVNKWAEVLDHPSQPKLDPSRRSMMAQLLENQEKASRDGMMSEGINLTSLLEAAPTNAMGAS